MPSATTADSSDSMAASSANAIASGNTAVAFAIENAGKAGEGNSRGMPPKREPMVSTGSENAAHTTAANTTAIRIPGQDGRQIRKAAMMAMLTTATATADGLTLSRPPASVSSFGT